MSSIVQHRRSIAASWVSVNPVLAQGELGFETDTRKGKVGDGVHCWIDLPYVLGPIAPTAEPVAAVVLVSPGTISAWDDWESGDVSVPGAVVGAAVAIGYPADWPKNAFVFVRVTAADTVRIRVYNFAAPNGNAPVVIAASTLQLRILP